MTNDGIMMHIDLKRCRRSLLYEGASWPLICAQDEFVEATADNYRELDFVWIHKPTPKTAAKQLWMLPFQGERFYSRCAVAFLVKTKRISIRTWASGSAPRHAWAPSFGSPWTPSRGACPSTYGNW